MSKRTYSFALASATILLASVIAAPIARANEDRDDQSETNVSWEVLPTAVKDALTNANPAMKFESLTRQEENGFVTYEAEYETDPGDAEIELTEAGEIIEMKSELKAESLPARVVERIEKRFPGAEIDDISMVRETYYELEFMTASGKTDVSFHADGSERENDAGDLSNRGGFDEEIDWEDAPKAVLDTLAAYRLAIEFDSLERDEKNGLVSYKAIYVGESGGGQIKLTEAGDVIENRKRIHADSLPVAIADQLNQRFPGAVVEDTTEFHETYYEVALKTDSNEIEIAYFADGTPAEHKH